MKWLGEPHSNIVISLAVASSINIKKLKAGECSSEVEYLSGIYKAWIQSLAMQKRK